MNNPKLMLARNKFIEFAQKHLRYLSRPLLKKKAKFYRLTRLSHQRKEDLAEAIATFWWTSRIEIDPLNSSHPDIPFLKVLSQREDNEFYFTVAEYNQWVTQLIPHSMAQNNGAALHPSLFPLSFGMEPQPFANNSNRLNPYGMPQMGGYPMVFQPVANGGFNPLFDSFNPLQSFHQFSNGIAGDLNNALFDQRNQPFEPKESGAVMNQVQSNLMTGLENVCHCGVARGFLGSVDLGRCSNTNCQTQFHLQCYKVKDSLRMANGGWIECIDCMIEHCDPFWRSARSLLERNQKSVIIDSNQNGLIQASLKIVWDKEASKELQANPSKAIRMFCIRLDGEPLMGDERWPDEWALIYKDEVILDYSKATDGVYLNPEIFSNDGFGEKTINMKFKNHCPEPRTSTTFVVSIGIGGKVTKEDLKRVSLADEVLAVSESKRLLKKVFGEQKERESLRMKLKSPGKSQGIQVPCRGVFCDHFDVFDFEEVIPFDRQKDGNGLVAGEKANEREVPIQIEQGSGTNSKGWKCPICQKSARRFKVDGFWLRILEYAREKGINEEEFDIHRNGLVKFGGNETFSEFVDEIEEPSPAALQTEPLSADLKSAFGGNGFDYMSCLPSLGKDGNFMNLFSGTSSENPYAQASTVPLGSSSHLNINSLLVKRTSEQSDLLLGSRQNFPHLDFAHHFGMSEKSHDHIGGIAKLEKTRAIHKEHSLYHMIESSDKKTEENQSMNDESGVQALFEKTKFDIYGPKKLFSPKDFPLLCQILKSNTHTFKKTQRNYFLNCTVAPTNPTKPKSTHNETPKMALKRWKEKGLWAIDPLNEEMSSELEMRFLNRFRKTFNAQKSFFQWYKTIEDWKNDNRSFNKVFFKKITRQRKVHGKIFQTVEKKQRKFCTSKMRVPFLPELIKEKTANALISKKRQLAGMGLPSTTASQGIKTIQNHVFNKNFEALNQIDPSVLVGPKLPNKLKTVELNGQVYSLDVLNNIKGLENIMNTKPDPMPSQMTAGVIPGSKPSENHSETAIFRVSNPKEKPTEKQENSQTTIEENKETRRSSSEHQEKATFEGINAGLRQLSQMNDQKEQGSSFFQKNQPSFGQGLAAPDTGISQLQYHPQLFGGFGFPPQSQGGFFPGINMFGLNQPSSDEPKKGENLTNDYINFINFLQQQNSLNQQANAFLPGALPLDKLYGLQEMGEEMKDLGTQSKESGHFQSGNGQHEKNGPINLE